MEEKTFIFKISNTNNKNNIISLFGDKLSEYPYSNIYKDFDINISTIINKKKISVELEEIYRLALNSPMRVVICSVKQLIVDFIIYEHKVEVGSKNNIDLKGGIEYIIGYGMQNTNLEIPIKNNELIEFSIILKSVSLTINDLTKSEA